jgi:hypothetical protein
MSKESAQFSRFTQETIDEAITEYFDAISKADPSNSPNTREIAVMIHDLLGKYISGDVNQAKDVFNFFVQCAVENVQSDQEIKRIMSMLKQLNESYKSLSTKYQVLNENYRTLQEEHEALMMDYLS